MKQKMTTKAVKTYFRNIHQACYCELATLLRYVEPVGYTSGKYGWNYDIYAVNGVTICTGYRNMPGMRVKQSSEYEKKARAIADNHTLDYDSKKAQIMELLEQFCKINGGY